MKKKIITICGILSLLVFEAKPIIPIQETRTLSLFMRSITERNFQSMRFFINCGANVNIRTPDGLTPLMVAVQSGNLEIIRFLLTHHADINARNLSGETPLMQAVHCRNFDVVKLLVNHHAIVDLRAYDGSSALSIAHSRGYWDIMSYLLAANSSQQYDSVPKFSIFDERSILR